MNGLDEAALAKVFATFRAEAEENLRAIEDGVMLLEAQADEAVVNEVFRAAHMLKGNASSLGLEELAEAAHVVEEILDRVRDGSLSPSPGLVTILLRSVDVLRESVARERGRSAASTAVDGGRVRPSARTLRVDVRKLDRILDLVGELAVDRTRLGRLIGESREASALRDAHVEADRRFADLQEEVLRLRLVPLAPLLRAHVRTVRDLAARSGKRVRVVVEASDVEVDTRVAELLRDPLVQLVRNSVDHGIESPEERAAARKDEVACLTLRALDEAGSIVVEVRDDGRGFDTARILAHARERGLVEPERVLSEREIHALVFAPGFSTAEHVTATSGRGVGMDIVQRNAELLRGTVTVDSRRGEGARVELRLPMTLAIIQGFGVGVGEETFVLPLDEILECVEAPTEDRDASLGVMDLRGAPIPFVRLGRLFAIARAGARRESVVVVRTATGPVGLIVDRLLGEAQTVVKPLGRMLDRVRWVKGSAVLGNGEVGLILDPARICEAMTASRASQATEGLS